MAATIKELIVMVSTQTAKSEAFQNSVKPGGAGDPKVEALKRRSQMADKKHAVELGQVHTRVAAQTEAFVDRIKQKSRRDEEIFQQRLLSIRQKNELQLSLLKTRLAKAEGKDGAFKGEGVKGLLTSGFGDKGTLVTMGVTLGVGFMSVAGPAMKGLAADLSGRNGGGPLTGMAREFWQGLGGLVEEGAGTARDFSKSTLGGFLTAGGSAAGHLISSDFGRSANRFISGSYYDGPENRMRPGLATDKGGPLSPTAARDQNISLLEQERDRLTQVAEARKSVLRVELETIEVSKRIADQERAKLQSAKEEFGMLTSRDKERYVTIAKKLTQPGGLNNLTPEQAEFAQSHRGFSSLITKQAGETAEASGWNEVVRILGADSALTQALKKIADAEVSMDKKAVNFGMTNNVNLMIDHKRMADELDAKLVPLIIERTKEAVQKIRDEMARNEARNRANAPGNF